MDLKVISFNIRCCDDPDGYSIAERAPRLEKVIHDVNPDLIGMQEMRPEWEPYLSEAFSDEYDMFNRYRAEEELESAPIFWKKDRFEVLKTGYFWLSDTPEVESRGWDELYNCWRMCEYVILREKESGQEFTFMNTHFGFGDRGQCGSARLIYEYSRKISELPTFVTGDFNMRNIDKGYAEMTKHFTDVNAVTARETVTTYHGYTPEKIDERIDYCFTDARVTPVSCRTMTETVDGKYPSDHFGLEIGLRI